MKFPNIFRRRQAAIVIRESAKNSGQWVKIGSGVRYNRDISETDLYEMADRAYRAWRFNPFVKRVTEMFVNYVVGTGLTFTAKDERVQAVLDEFVKRNKIHLRMKKRARDLFLTGELAGIPTVNVASGRVSLAFIPSIQTQKVVLNPLNGDDVVAVVVRGEFGEPISLPVVREDSDGTAAIKIPELYGDKRPAGFNAVLSTSGRKTGRAFYHGRNLILGATRGTSDLLTILDWCSGTEDLLWDMRTRAEKQNDVIGVIKIKGAKPTQLKKYRDKDDPEYIPYPGEDGTGWNWVNDEIDFSFVSPNLGASDMAITVRLFKNMISLGGGPPEHLMGEGDAPNRATAMEIGDPFYQLMASSQSEFIELWLDIAEYVVDQKLIFTKELDGVKDLSVTVSGPEIAVRDEQRRAETAKLFTDIVVTWKMNGMINDDQSLDMMNQIAIAAGLKVKVSEEMPDETGKQDWTKKALKNIKQNIPEPDAELNRRL